jgi:potassium-dependent mechanosensitive channel
MQAFLGLLSAILGKKAHFAGADVTLGDALGAGVTVLVAYVLARVLRRIVERRIRSHPSLTPNARFLLLRAITVVILCVGVVAALNMLQIRLTGLAVTFGFLSVGIGFGLQNITSNFVSGIILLFERPVRVGDLITVGENLGRVEAIGIRSTLLRTADNVELIIPNSQFIEQTVTNWTYKDKTARIHVPIGVAYGTDVELVRRILLDIGQASKHTLDDPAPAVQLTAFGESSLDFELLVWIPDPSERKDAVSDLNFAIDAAFREHGIEIPFPQRDVRVVSTDA